MLIILEETEYRTVEKRRNREKAVSNKSKVVLLFDLKRGVNTFVGKKIRCTINQCILDTILKAAEVKLA